MSRFKLIALISNKEPTDQATTEDRSNEQKETEQALEKAMDTQSEYHANLRGIAEDIHPFDLENNKINHSKQIEEALEQRIQDLEALAKAQGINDKKETAQKFRNQIEALSSSVNAWWFWVHSLLQDLDIETEKIEWLTKHLLPVIHWHHQLNKTQNKDTKEKYQQAWEQASQTLKHHPFIHAISESELQQWIEWSQWMVRQFHRSSSAVEGRNGCLSQMYHNGRGLTEGRLKALTVIHNYGIKRHDGK